MKGFKNSTSIMTTIFRWMLFSFLLPFSLAASDIIFSVSDLPESFPSQTNPLWTFQDREVEVRGFWYPLSPDQGILAPTPNLKSCCIGTPTKVSQQLIVKGRLPSSYDQQAVAVRGVFKIEPLYDFEGQLIQLYVLEKPKEVEREFFPLSLIVVCGGLSLTVLYFIKRTRTR